MVGARGTNFACSSWRTNLYEELAIHRTIFFPLRRNIIFVINGLDWANRFASAAIHTLIGLDVKHATAFVNTVDRALLNTGLVLHIDTRLSNYVSHDLLQNFDWFKQWFRVQNRTIERSRCARTSPEPAEKIDEKREIPL